MKIKRFQITNLSFFSFFFSSSGQHYLTHLEETFDTWAELDTLVQHSTPRRIHAERTRLLRQVYSYPLWWCGTHTFEEDHTPPSLLCHEWVECGHPTEWSQLASTWQGSRLYCMLHVLAYASNKRHWIIWVVLLYFTWELNKDYTVTEDPSRYPGIGPSTIQPQHTSSNGIILIAIFFSENQSFLMRHFRKKTSLLLQKSINVFYIIYDVPN